MALPEKRIGNVDAFGKSVRVAMVLTPTKAIIWVKYESCQIMYDRPHWIYCRLSTNLRSTNNNINNGHSIANHPKARKTPETRILLIWLQGCIENYRILKCAWICPCYRKSRAPKPDMNWKLGTRANGLPWRAIIYTGCGFSLRLVFY